VQDLETSLDVKPQAQNNQWLHDNSSGRLHVVDGMACTDNTNCCLAVAPPPPPPPAPCFASAAAGPTRITAVVVGDNSTPAEEFAARELAEHLGNMSGVTIDILRRKQADAGRNYIAVGYDASLQAGIAPGDLTAARLGDENFTIRNNLPSGRPGQCSVHRFISRLIILDCLRVPAGGGASKGNFALSGREHSPRGTLYAVYVFLEWIGVRWWAPDETFFPACPPVDRFTWAAEEQWCDSN
jgi:hypothetical protein